MLTAFKGLSTPGNKVAENGNKLLPETATLTGATIVAVFGNNLLPGVEWTGLNRFAAPSVSGLFTLGVMST